ncbi:MAG: ATP-binding cassette domain-containing protein [Promethearchaeota archaeon]
MELFLQQEKGKEIDKKHRNKAKKLLLLSFKQNSSSKSVIECRSAFKFVKINKKKDFPVISDFDLIIEKGELITIAGETGSGKTIILKLLSGYLKPDKGSVVFNNEEISKQRIHPHISMISKVAYMPQHFNIGESTSFKGTPFDVLERFASSFLKKKDIPSQVLKILSGINLDYKRTLDCKFLSSGEIQRLIIGVILVKNPLVVFLDMPLNHQDPVNSEKLIKMLVKYCSETQTAIVAATNNISFMKKSKKTVLINEGKIHNIEVHENWIQQHNLEMLTSDEHLNEEKNSISFFCPLCNFELNDKPETCPNCSAPLIWE